MIIKEPDFILEQVSETSPLWNLSLIHTKKTGTEEMKVDAYGTTLESALRKIIAFRINKKAEVMTLQEYLKEWRTMVNEIKQIVEI